MARRAMLAPTDECPRQPAGGATGQRGSSLWSLLGRLRLIATLGHGAAG